MFGVPVITRASFSNCAMLMANGQGQQVQPKKDMINRNWNSPVLRTCHSTR